MHQEKNLYLKESEINGRGIFTSVKIPAGSHVMIIRGEVISETECVRREEEESNVYIFWNEYNYIDTSNSELIRYLNHNCDPNCYVEERDEESLLLIAERDIVPGEEITIDYDYEEIYEGCACSECTSEIYA
ncbi:MAG: SET domain-containing protein [Ignavibacteriales bacterium]|nr:MAG: SET domain-containing protein [Ignavibacteriales bacterium]